MYKIPLFIALVAFSACVPVAKYNNLRQSLHTAETVLQAKQAALDSLNSQTNRCAELEKENAAFRLSEKEKNERVEMVVQSAAQKVRDAETKLQQAQREKEKLEEELRKLRGN